MRFAPAPGVYSAMPRVSIASDSRHALLYYTLDGSIPTPQSAVYERELELQTTTLVRVASYLGDRLVAQSSASYIELAPELAATDSNLPLIVVHMLDGAPPDPARDEWLPAIMQLHVPNENGRAELAGAAQLNARVGFKVHGRKTRVEPKHSFSLELRDEHDDDDESATLLDLPPQSDYVLHSPDQVDRALIRNALFYRLGRDAGRWAPRTRFVELYLASNGKAVDASAYLGLFVLTETVKRDPARLAIAKLRPEDTSLPRLSGGYIVRIDAPDPGELVLPVVGLPNGVVLRYPDQTVIASEQLDYLMNDLNTCGRALAAPDYIDPDTSQCAGSLIDVSSFIDYHILNMFAKNADAFRLSTYMYKDRDAARTMDATAIPRVGRRPARARSTSRMVGGAVCSPIQRSSSATGRVSTSCSAAR